MNWQMALVLVLVTAAAWYLVRCTWRTWNPKKKNCGGGCACAGKGESDDKTALISVEQTRLRGKAGD